MDAAVLEDGGGAVEGEAFGDGAQVEESVGAGVGVERAVAGEADILGEGEEVGEVRVDAGAGVVVEAGDVAVGGEAGEAVVPVLDFAEGFLARGTQVDGVLADEDELEACAHGVGGEEHHLSLMREALWRDAAHQARIAVRALGSKENAPPSHIDRVARSTTTMTLRPSSTLLMGFSRVRMLWSQPRRWAS